MTSPARLLLPLLTIAICCSCQTTDPNAFGAAKLYGVVYDETRLPVGGVMIDAAVGEPVVSDVNGRFALSNVSQGPVQFTATRTGYRTLRDEFDFGNRTHILYIKMESASALRNAIEIRMEAGGVDESLQLCHELLEIDTNNPVSRYLAGIVFHLAGEQARAIEQVDWLMAHDVKDAAVATLREAIAERDGTSADGGKEGM